MSTKIEWTNETWNPIIGCSKISEGCKNCYAERMAGRLSNITKTAYYLKVVEQNRPALLVIKGLPKWNGETQFINQQLLKPTQWKKPRKIFVCSMGDLFHESIPFEWIDVVFSIMSDIDQHIYQVLTKRPFRMQQFYDWKAKQLGVKWQAKDNVWIGVTVESQEQVYRILPLLKVPSKIRFISCEPLLSNIDLYPWLDEYIGPSETGHNDWLNGLNWVIVGGESGPEARPMHPEWVRSLKNQCKISGTPFFFKQWGEWYTDWLNIQTKEPVFKMYPNYQKFQQKLWVRKGDSCIDMNGKICKNGGDMKTASYPVAIMQKIGKQKSGVILDGKEYKQFPKI